MNSKRCAQAGLLFALCDLPTTAGVMPLQWQDPLADGMARGDVSSVRLQFDSSGHWTASWYADPLHPFNGNVRFNLNLFDTALGNAALAQAPQVSLDGFHDFQRGSAGSYSYSGQTSFLSNWHVGDVVTTANGTNFISGLVDQQSPFASDKLFAKAAIARSVPEPASLALIATTLGALMLARFSRRSVGQPK